MRITPVLSRNSFWPMFGAIVYESFNPKYNSQKASLKREIDTFSTSLDNAEFLGSGLFADAYVFDRFPDIVIKKSNIGDDFSEEEGNLKLIASEIKNTQKFVARAYDDDDYEYYLLSTRVDGESPDPEDNPLTRIHLRNLFNTMYEMDDTGLYHGDLNNGNIKITPDGRVNLLDFQFTHKIEEYEFFDEKDKSTLPDFMMIENAQMFEQAGLPYYLTKIGSKSQAKSFLRLYLTEKSTYHQKRYEFLSREVKSWPYSSDKPKIKKSLKYEKARAEVFRNPSENVLRLEAKKIQFLNSFREAFRRMDKNVPHKNIIPAGTSYLVTLSNIQDFRKEVARQQRQANNPNMRAYLDGLEEYGDFWFEKVKEWSDNAFWYPIRHANGKLEPWENERYDFDEPDNNIEDFGAMTNVAGSIDDSYLPKYTKGFAFKTQSVLDNINSACAEVNTIAKAGLPSGTSSTFYELRDTYNKLSDAYNKGWAMDVINLATLCVARASQLKDASPPYSTVYRSADSIMRYCSKAAETCFKKMFKEITEDNPNTSTLTGYGSMGNFA